MLLKTAEALRKNRYEVSVFETKEEAVDYLAGLFRGDTIGFGDSMNDLQMIETVGTSVCMANGAKALQKISDLVVPSVEEDGLYEGFRKLKLINE